jgi:hypothetical protein
VQTLTLDELRNRVDRLVANHPVVTDNRYTRWFARGEATRADVRHLTTQFSVFSHLFIEAQLRKVINAPSLEGYRAGKEILLNELGVVFRPTSAGADDSTANTHSPIGSEGSVEGGTFHFAAAHFEWLVRFAEPLGLSFEDLGKSHRATPETRTFCDALLRLYGSEDPVVGEGASYAVEHWAAAGFWKELIAGLERFKARECPDLNLGFWVWHDQLEDQHAAHTGDELVDVFYLDGFNVETYLAAAEEMLDGIKVFWDGLDVDRRLASA